MTDNGPTRERTASDLNFDTRLTHAIYALMALSYFTGGFTAIVAIVMNYVKLPDVRGTWLETHFRWQIRTFWFGLLWALIGIALLIVGIGFIVLIANFVWLIYRVIKGWLLLNDDKPAPR
jgi:uncharacterized membrane protein